LGGLQALPPGVRAASARLAYVGKVSGTRSERAEAALRSRSLRAASARSESVKTRSGKCISPVVSRSRNLLSRAVFTKKRTVKVLRERHTTGEMHFPLLVFTLSSLAEAALRSGSRSGGLKPARDLALAPGHLGSHESGLFQTLPYVLLVRFVRSPRLHGVGDAALVVVAARIDGMHGRRHVGRHIKRERVPGARSGRLGER